MLFYCWHEACTCWQLIQPLKVSKCPKKPPFFGCEPPIRGPPSYVCVRVHSSVKRITVCSSEFTPAMPASCKLHSLRQEQQMKRCGICSVNSCADSCTSLHQQMPPSARRAARPSVEQRFSPRSARLCFIPLSLPLIAREVSVRGSAHSQPRDPERGCEGEHLS